VNLNVRATNEVHDRRDIFIPKLLQWILRTSLSNLKNKYLKKNADVEYDINFAKVEGLINSFISRNTHNIETGQNPNLALYPEVSNKPYWNKGDSIIFDRLMNCLTENFDLIHSEYIANS